MAPIVVAIGRGSAADVVKSAGKWTECGVMRNLIILAGILIGLGTSMAEIADRITPARANGSERKHHACVGRPAERGPQP